MHPYTLFHNISFMLNLKDNMVINLSPTSIRMKMIQGSDWTVKNQEIVLRMIRSAEFAHKRTTAKALCKRQRLCKAVLLSQEA